MHLTTQDLYPKRNFAVRIMRRQKNFCVVFQSLKE